MSAARNNGALIYCCASSPTQNVQPDNGTNDIDVIRLNAALHELGMLSAITNSRKQYLEEKATAASARKLGNLKHTECKSVCLAKSYCVFRMNSNYVTNFASAWKSDLAPNSSRLLHMQRNLDGDKSNECNAPVGLLSLQKKDAAKWYFERSRPRTNRLRLRFQRPYEIPWVHKLENRKLSSETSSSSIEAASDDGGNRSNPESPEKATGDSSSGLVRSRSLDDIETMNMSVLRPDNTNLMHPLSDVEKVSQTLERLQVN